MRCLFVYKEEYPWDVRVEKIIKSLLNARHDVVLVCRNLESAPTEESGEGFLIRRLPRMPLLPLAIRKLTSLPLWFNPICIFTVVRAACKLQPDVVIVRDLPLMLTGYIAARLTKSRLIYDMAECYPEMYQSARQFSRRRRGWGAVKSPLVAKWYEGVSLRLTDHVLVMIEESRDRLLKMGISANKVTIVSNTPSLLKVPDLPRVHEGADLRVIYVGFLTRIRGLDILIQGVRAFLDSVGEAALIEVDIVGKGAARAELMSLVKELGLEQRVRIHGWLEHTEVANLMNNANVGALTYRVCGHWNHTIPNKIFDYMAMGLPVLATDVRPIGRILNKFNCGVVCRDEDAMEVGAKRCGLRDAKFRQYLGSNGHAAVREHCNWEIDEVRLVAVVEQLLGRSTGTKRLLHEDVSRR